MNTEAIDDHNALHTTGERLRSARKQRGLSQQAVAERLCLKVSTVRDIEEDKVPAELAATFVRGYICAYARLVHIPENELLPMLEKQAPVKMAKVAPMRGYALGKRRKKRDGWLMSITWLVLFVVVGLTGAWWWQNHKAQQEEITTMADRSTAELNANPSVGQAVPLNTDIANHDAAAAQAADNDGQPATALTEANTDSDVATTTPDASQNTLVAPIQANVDTATAVPAIPSAVVDSVSVLSSGLDPVADPNALVMNFIADCWLEVIDATGKKLFSGLQHKDASLNLIGQAPYTLKIGAPGAVQIQYLGKPVDLSRFIRANQVARLTLNAESSVAQ